MIVKFPLMFVVSFVAIDINRTKGLFYAFNAMGGRNLKFKYLLVQIDSSDRYIAWWQKQQSLRSCH